MRTLHRSQTDGGGFWREREEGLGAHSQYYLLLLILFFWEMLIACAANGVYINKCISHKPVVSLGNVLFPLVCVRSNNQAG